MDMAASGMNLSVKSLESLCLDGVSWKTFPPLGELWLVDVSHEEFGSNVIDERFENLRRLELLNLPSLKKWAVHAPCRLFPFLEVLSILDCSELVELSFSHSACCQQEKEEKANIFPRLSELKIRNCPQLLSFPTVPWTEAPCSIQIDEIGHPCLRELFFIQHSNPYGNALIIQGQDTEDSTFWNVLAFHNLSRLKELIMSSCPPLAMHHLKMLSSLRHLSSKNTIPLIEGNIHVKYQFSVESLSISQCSASAKELTQLLTYFPRLLELSLHNCENITGLGASVMGQQATAIPGPSSSSAEEGLLLLPPKLQTLDIDACTHLSICSSAPDNHKGLTRRGGLECLSSLQWLTIKVLTFYSSSHFPFTNSLESLALFDVVGMETLEPLSNLMFLTSLTIARCGELRCKGLLPLLTQGHLTKLGVAETPNFFVDSEPLPVHELLLRASSSKLKELCTDYVGGLTATPICSLLCSSLSKLDICMDQKVERFTEEQLALLFVNSIKEINLVSCENLEDIPVQLRTLSNLKSLQIHGCKAMKVLPEDGLPSSLQSLIITNCPEIRSLPKDCLPTSLQVLVIRSCPAIRSLPKVDDLPSSLRELDVSQSGSKELKRQCRKYIGSIPIVRTD